MRALTSAHGTAELAVFRNNVAPHLSRSIEGLPLQRGPDGRRRVDFQGRFGSGHVLRKEPDGTTRIQCVTSVTELDALLSSEGSSR